MKTKKIYVPYLVACYIGWWGSWFTIPRVKWNILIGKYDVRVKDCYYCLKCKD